MLHLPQMASSSESGKSTSRTTLLQNEPNRLRRFLKMLGPGFISGASDDDPSGVGTYAMAGAAYGYATLWLALVTFPMMTAVQFICAKVGMVTGRGLAGVIRQHYSRKLLYPVVCLLIIANTINAGADIGAVAAGVNLIVPIPALFLIVPVGVVIFVLQVWGSFRLIVNVFKWLALTLLGYIGASFFARPDFAEVIRGTLLPTLHFDGAFLAMIVAVLGTTISPYLFFWQASQEVEEEVARGRKRLWQRTGATEGELTYAAWDVGIGMLFSNVVMYFIILATAATLHRAGKTDITTAAEAAIALRPLAGDGAALLMGLGLVGSGLLAIPVLTTSGAYALCETFGWQCSLGARPGRAKEFYLVIGASTLIGLFLNFVGINPIHALFWTAVINGFLAPPLLLIIMIVANSKSIMGKRVNGLGINILGGLTTLAMFAAAIGVIVTWGQ